MNIMKSRKSRLVGNDKIKGEVESREDAAGNERECRRPRGSLSESCRQSGDGREGNKRLNLYARETVVDDGTTETKNTNSEEMVVRRPGEDFHDRARNYPRSETV